MPAVIRFALLSLCLSLPAFGQTQALNSSKSPTPPAPFIKLVPREFPNGLKLVDLTRVPGGQPWRTIDIPAQQEGTPARQEKVSVADGVRAMYAFPGTPYFANTKIEFSVTGRYAQDKATVLDALTHQCTSIKAHIDDYVSTHPDAREKLDRTIAKGKAYVTYESGNVQGVEYALCTQNALNLSGSVPAMLHIFVPQREVIVTAYLLQQKQSKFQTIDEFLTMQHEFIDGYIDFLQRP
jgi:hypothetical protein